MALDLNNVITNAVATLALLVSIISIVLNVRSERRQRKFNETTERLNALQIEREQSDATVAKRADLSANFVKTGKHSWSFRIYNRGKAIARNVRMEPLDGQELFESSRLETKFPYPTLDTHHSFDLIARVHMQSPSRATVRLLWDDDAGGGDKTITADVY